MITKTDLTNTPSGPGVYYFWEKDHPIYIGKAVNIKARVLTHLQNSKLDTKERKIIERATRVSFKETFSEFEALILEAESINAHQPIYNVVLKDDKSSLYIKITIKETYPKIFAVRRESDRKSLYFGPFESAKLTSTIIHEMRKIVPFCTQKKIGMRPCFYSKIGLCNPCPSYIEKASTEQRPELRKQYKKNIAKIRQILRGNSGLVLNQFSRELLVAIKNEDYEGGIVLRNKIHLFKQILLSRSFYSEGRLLRKTQKDISKELSDFLDTYFHRKVEFNKAYVSRIECFDISNLFGKLATGSMVVFVDGLARKDQYRRFKIRSSGKRSDFDMMEEVISRRLSNKEWKKPDLIILDGGRPQLRKIRALFSKLQITIPLVGIAKKPDRLIAATNGMPPLALNRRAPLFHLIQEIRDESHRFAKKYHLLLRQKQLMI